MRGESPGYPIADAPEDNGVEQWAWVPTDRVATAAEAVEWFNSQWPDAVRNLDDNGMGLVATGETSWHRLSGCLSCDGTGEGERPRSMDDWPRIVAGPPPACYACEGSGRQPEDGDGDYVSWEACRADDDGAVEFWTLEAVELA
jgi:hypothetical protein